MHALVKSTNVRATLRRMSASKGSLFKNLQAVADSQFTQCNKNIIAMSSHIEVTACSQFSPLWQPFQLPDGKDAFIFPPKICYLTCQF